MLTPLLLCVTLVSLAIAPVRPPPNLPPVANDDVVIVQYQPEYVDIQVLENDLDAFTGASAFGTAYPRPPGDRTTGAPRRRARLKMTKRGRKRSAAAQQRFFNAFFRDLRGFA